MSFSKVDAQVRKLIKPFCIKLVAILDKHHYVYNPRNPHNKNLNLPKLTINAGVYYCGGQGWSGRKLCQAL
jgi:hypothetical protein